MKSKLFWSVCTVLVASLPIPAFAQTSPPTSPEVSFDYKGGSKKYQLLPGRIQDRSLPKAFDFPIITNVATDTSTKDYLITDQFSAPPGRTEYTGALTAWAASIRECLAKQPRLIRKTTGNPVLINGREGTIVRNANNRAICQ